MKTLSKILLVIALIAAIYFATIGRNDFFRILDTVQDVIQAFAGSYLKK